MIQMDKKNKPTIICITAMKNEAWILDRFLKCTETWADHIILLNQNSEDNSENIAQNYHKVILKQNTSKEFNDYNHWNILMEESRKIQSDRKIIISIDCDEFLSANTFQSAEWLNFIYNAPEGSLMVCNRFMVSENFKSYRKEPDFLIGFVDDGISSISQLEIKKNVHNIRLPYPANNPNLYKMNTIKLLHYNVVDYRRYLSKMLWYQCFEVTLKDKKINDILNQYYTPNTFEEFWKLQPFFEMDYKWIEGYENNGIDMTSVISNSIYYWWDEKIINYFVEFGTKPFNKIPIWHINWKNIASVYNIDIKEINFNKRNILEKIYTKMFLLNKKTSSKFIRFFSSIYLKINI
jgi:hypothetical protein